MKVPHPTLIAIGISVAITAVMVGIFAMADSGMVGTSESEAAKRIRPMRQ